MNTDNNIKNTIPADDVQMGDVLLKQPLPTATIKHADPFLLLHHVGPLHQEAGQKSVLDIGGHPHRGFEPVTFIFKGEVHHRDSRGNDSIIKSGGVQWMTAGMGIVHSESAPKSFVEEGGELELIQLWVNLPSHLKMVQPRYQGHQKEEISVIQPKDQSYSLNIIAGNYNGLKGPVESITGIQAYTLDIQAGSSCHLDINPEHQMLIYQLEGAATINGSESKKHQMTTFNIGAESTVLSSETFSRFLIISGRPLEENVTQYGPFVMNTQTEVLEAMRDYQMGKMGILI